MKIESNVVNSEKPLDFSTDPTSTLTNGDKSSKATENKILAKNANDEDVEIATFTDKGVAFTKLGTPPDQKLIEAQLALAEKIAQKTSKANGKTTTISDLKVENPSPWFERCQKTQRIDNFLDATGSKKFNDPDVYKDNKVKGFTNFGDGAFYKDIPFLPRGLQKAFRGFRKPIFQISKTADGNLIFHEFKATNSAARALIDIAQKMSPGGKNLNVIAPNISQKMVDKMYVEAYKRGVNVNVGDGKGGAYQPSGWAQLKARIIKVFSPGVKRARENMTTTLGDTKTDQKFSQKNEKNLNALLANPYDRSVFSAQHVTPQPSRLAPMFAGKQKAQAQSR